MHRTIFTIDGLVPAYIGYTSGRLWNGWATPYFTLEEAKRVQADFNKDTEYPMVYDSENDEFRNRYEEYEEPYIWKGEDIQTEDGIKHLYGIGAYCWVWDAVNDGDRRYIAQQIDELLYEHDTYNYWDGSDALREQVVNTIMEQLKDLDTFHKVIYIVEDEKLSEEERYEKLGGILTL